MIAFWNNLGIGYKTLIIIICIIAYLLLCYVMNKYDNRKSNSTETKQKYNKHK